MNLARNVKRSFFLLFLIAALALTLRLFRLNDLMSFIGDAGWFYISARDMIISGQIPLVGITASRTWLHQGPYWTYVLALGFKMFGFRPLIGGYIAVGFGVLSTVLMYRVVKGIFSTQAGIVASVLFATSPLVIFYSRVPYHTAPIPFFVLVFVYFLYEWRSGKHEIFPFIILSLVILYNFELATSVFIFIFILYVAIVFFQNRTLFKKTISFRNILVSFSLFFIGMLPIIIYDFQHGFPQLFKFTLWIPYRMLVVFQNNLLSGNVSEFLNTVRFILFSITQLIFPFNTIIALVLFSVSLATLSFFAIADIRSKKWESGSLLITITLFVPIIGLFLNKTPSDAYIPMIFPSIVMVVAYFFHTFLQRPQTKKYFFIVLCLVVSMNIYYVFRFLESSGLPFSKRLNAAKEIVQDAGGKRFNIIGSGSGSQFRSFTANYEYLTWWLGNSPSHEKEKLQYIISEPHENIVVQKRVTN